MTVVATGGQPTLADAALQLGVQESGLSAEFGVLLVDPANGVYCVEVYADSLPPEKPRPEEDGTYRGPFSNPRIEPAGPGNGEGPRFPGSDQEP